MPRAVSTQSRARVSHAEPVNLAFGTNTTLLDLIEEMQRGHRRSRRWCSIATTPRGRPHSRADNAMLRSLFPDIAPVSLSDGLSATSTGLRRRHEEVSLSLVKAM